MVGRRRDPDGRRDAPRTGSPSNKRPRPCEKSKFLGCSSGRSTGSTGTKRDEAMAAEIDFRHFSTVFWKSADAPPGGAECVQQSRPSICVRLTPLESGRAEFSRQPPSPSPATGLLVVTDKGGLIPAADSYSCDLTAFSHSAFKRTGIFAPLKQAR